MAALNEKEQMVMSLVNKFGCISMDQVYAFFPTFEKKSIQLMVSQMVKKRYLSIVNNTNLVAYGKTTNYKRKNIDMLWAIMTVAKNNYEDVVECLHSQPPCDYALTVQGNQTFKFTMVSPTKIAEMVPAMEKSKKNEEKYKKGKLFTFESYFVFVCTDAESVKYLKEIDFPSMVLVAFVDHPESGKPTVKVMKKMPKTD